MVDQSTDDRVQQALINLQKQVNWFKDYAEEIGSADHLKVYELLQDFHAKRITKYTNFRESLLKNYGDTE